MAQTKRRKAPNRHAGNPPPAAREALTIPEAAVVMGCSPSTVWRLLDDGELPRVRIGRRVYVSRTEVERFLSHGGTRTAALRPRNGK